jgi:hypothetical protein
MHEDEFYLVTPTALKGVLIIPLMIVCVVSLLSFEILPTEIEPFLFLAACAGIAFFILFTGFVLWDFGTIMRFRRIKKIVIYGYGIALYRKDDNVARLIRWQQINEVRFRGAKHVSTGVFKTQDVPGSIIFDLDDGSDLEIPLHMVLMGKDHLRFMSAISRYLTATVETGASH